jgi:hypothetical protein
MKRGLNDGSPDMTSSHTVGAFGDVMTVLHANCEFENAGGDCAVYGQGANRIRRFHWQVLRPGTADQLCQRKRRLLDSCRHPYRSWVLDMAVDGTQLLLLFSTDATSPNSCRWSASTRKSLITSLPSAIAHAKSASTRPGHGRAAAATPAPSTGPPSAPSSQPAAAPARSPPATRSLRRQR